MVSGNYNKKKKYKKGNNQVYIYHLVKKKIIVTVLNIQNQNIHNRETSNYNGITLQLTRSVMFFWREKKTSPLHFSTPDHQHHQHG